MNSMPITYSTKLAGLSVYGDGKDGDITISTNTTLNRDMYYNNLTINASCNLDPAGYRIFVKNTLTFADSTSTIQRLTNLTQYGTLAGAHSASINSYSTSAAAASEVILGGRSQYVTESTSVGKEYFYDITKLISAMYVESNSPVFGGASGTKGAVGTSGTSGAPSAGGAGSAGQDPTDGNTVGVPGGRGSDGTAGTPGTGGAGGAGGVGGFGGPIIMVLAKTIVGSGKIIADGFAPAAGSLGAPGNAGTAGTAGTSASDKTIPGNVATNNPTTYPVSQSSFTNPTYYYFAPATTNPTYYYFAPASGGGYVPGSISYNPPTQNVAYGVNPVTYGVSGGGSFNPTYYAVGQASTKNPGGTYNATFYKTQTAGTQNPTNYAAFGGGNYNVTYGTTPGNTNAAQYYPYVPASYPVQQSSFTNTASYPVSQASFSNPTYYYTAPGNAATYNPTIVYKGGAGGAAGAAISGNSGGQGSSGYVGGGGVVFLVSTSSIPAGLSTSVKAGTTGQVGSATDGKVVVVNHKIID